MLNAISGANLVRRQRVALVAAQAFGVSKLLARDPANADLVPHVQEIKRLKHITRRKKSAPPAEQPQSPAPVPPLLPKAHAACRRSLSKGAFVAAQYELPSLRKL